MEYFQLRMDNVGACSSCAVDVEGNSIEVGSTMAGREIFARIDSTDRRPLGDLIYRANPTIVSENAIEVIQNFTLPDDSRIFPVTLESVLYANHGNEIHRQGSIGNAYGILLNWPDTDIMSKEDEKAYLKLDPIDRIRGKTAPPVVLRESVEGFDLVNGGGLGFLVSESLKLAIEEARLTNFVFHPVKLR